MDPERTERGSQHQKGPDPADGPMRQRALGRAELNDAERERRHRCEECMEWLARHPTTA
jgi:hypothetical protein